MKALDSDLWTDAFLLKCPNCDEPICATRSLEMFEYPKLHEDWGSLTRVWPNPAARLDHRIPMRVRTSLDEARRCINAESYLASAVMVRRALEAITKQFGSTERVLLRGLADLGDRGVIDARMFEWADSLRKHGNLGAHDTDHDVTEQDAKDLLEFAESICDYIFVLTTKFAAFQERQLKVAQASTPIEQEDS